MNIKKFTKGLTFSHNAGGTAVNGWQVSVWELDEANYRLILEKNGVVATVTWKDGDGNVYNEVGDPPAIIDISKESYDKLPHDPYSSTVRFTAAARLTGGWN